MMPTLSSTWGVVGCGRSGLAAARWLAAGGSSIVLTDDDSGRLGAAVAHLADGVTTCSPDADSASRAGQWVVSPGVPPSHPLVRRIMEQGHAWSDLDLLSAAGTVSRLVAVTGTNGKSTVTQLIADIYKANGQAVAAGGNLGTPIAELLSENFDIAVIEASSFQLFYARQFEPDVSVLTSLAPDHLDWHPDYDHYADAKRKMFPGRSVSVVPEGLLEIIGCRRGDDVLTVGISAQADLQINNGRIHVRAKGLDQSVAVPHGFEPAHQSLNLALALGVAVADGIALETAISAAASFKPLPFRFQLAGIVAGAAFVNDSKATNLDAMATAVESATGPVRLLVGGKKKGLDWTSVLSGISQKVVSAYAYGETAADIRNAWTPAVDIQTFEGLEDAFLAASADAVAGDIVLLAPGTSSFDQYTSYAERGRHFDQLVKQLVREKTS